MRPPNLVLHSIEVHTSTLRVHGTLHARRGIPLNRLLNTPDRQHLTLTSTRLYPPSITDPPTTPALYSSEFAAIPKNEIRWVIGAEPDPSNPAMQLQPRVTYLVYPNYVIDGDLMLRPEIRFSDAIGNMLINKPYVTLINARIRARHNHNTPIPDLPITRASAHITIDLRTPTAILDHPGARARDPIDHERDAELFTAPPSTTHEHRIHARADQYSEQRA